MVTKKASKKAAPRGAKRATYARKTARKSTRSRSDWKKLNGFFVQLRNAAKKLHDASERLARSDPKFGGLEEATLDVLNVLEDLVEKGPGGPPGADH